MHESERKLGKLVRTNEKITSRSIDIHLLGFYNVNTGINNINIDIKKLKGAAI
jgi:hypothetical protein